MSQSAIKYKGFPVSAEGPYQESEKFPHGHWYGTMGGRIVTTPASTREAAIQDAQAAVDQVVDGYLQAHGEKGQELLDLTESMLKQR